jgi:hypothetical protein
MGAANIPNNRQLIWIGKKKLLIWQGTQEFEEARCK